MDERLIVRAIQHLYSDWEPPKQGRNKWCPTLCPFHGDSRASAAVSYEFDAFSCLACGVKGNWRSLLKKEGGLTDSEIDKVAEGLSTGGDRQVQRKPARQPGRRVFEDSGPGDIVTDSPGRDRPVQARVRGRPTPWA